MPGGRLACSALAGVVGAAGRCFPEALTCCRGRRSTSETSATITGAAAAPSSVPGPQIRAIAKDAEADAALAMTSVCTEMPVRAGRSGAA